ncbi:MAG: electron transfer flavoprotein subunit beta/FixA family protein [Bdellovibrionales bacterium]|nr:electron transfer flavoprotein subunit beta/FixA family protein [Bdellovibrionales bacterium]
MKIGVCIKQVPDTSAQIAVNSEGTGIDESSIKWVISPYDEFAIEQALQIKEKIGDQASVTVFSVGPAKVQEALRTALATGCDHAVHIETQDRWSLDHHSIAKILAQALDEESCELTFVGKQSIDDDSGHIGPMIAQKRQHAHASVVDEFELSEDLQSAKVKKNLEGGLSQVWTLSLPLLVSTTKGLNQPRYASLKGIMQAKKKPLSQKKPQDYGVEESTKGLQWNHFFIPAQQRGKKMFSEGAAQDAEKVVGLLRQEAKVI